MNIHSDIGSKGAGNLYGSDILRWVGRFSGRARNARFASSCPT